jgi:3-isopropylmalate/(R)-2-methylmalate dehydratase small subunit
VPLLVDDVDTDVITPIGRVLQGGSALVKFAFEPLRYDAAGRLRGDCPLDDPRYAGAQILIAGENFACGSSRETAVWAVRGLGFRCVIAPSFGDIFTELLQERRAAGAARGKRRRSARQLAEGGNS